MPDVGTLVKQVQTLSKALSAREKRHKIVEPYYEGSCPLPMAVTQARMTRAYRYLMPMAEASWGSLVVDSVLDRLEVTGISSGDKTIDEKVWGIWQDNSMDAESSLAHTSALIDGRAFAYVWPGESGDPEITLDEATQMIVQYEEGSRHRRVAALRRWVDENGVPFAKLFHPDATYKFRGPKDYGWEDGITWGILSDEEIDNPYETVPVVELAVNRRLRPGSYGHARGEYEHVMGLIDRINLLTFLGLVVAIWLGFPLRGVIGDKILRDDNNDPIPPFDANADSVFQLEHPDAKIVSYDAADRSNLSVFDELSHLAMLTKTPRHYFPQAGSISNVSADTIRADEGGLHAKVNGKHKPFLGEGWEEVLRLGGKMLDDEADLSRRAELVWADHESRSLAERADAFSKLTDLPWMARAEIALNATPEQIRRWATERGNDPLSILSAAAMAPPPPPPSPAPSGNGAGA